ncbi:MAG: MlaD family protein [Thermodesulfobacteriota bacterium]
MGIREKDPRFRNLEVKTGVLVLFAVIGVLLVMVLIGRERDLFTKKYRLHFVSESGAGIVKGMPVKLSGFKIGRVRSIELTGDARVEVFAEVNKRYERWIREGSRARLVKEGFIGDAFVEITGGDPEGRMLADGEVLPFERTGGIETLIREAKPVLKEIKEIIDYANDPEGDIKVILENMRGLTVELNRSREAMADTMREFSATVRESRAFVRKLDAVADDLGPAAARLGSISGRAERISVKVEKIVDDLGGITGMMSAEKQRIRRLLIDAGQAASDGRHVMKGLRRSWPIRLMLPGRTAPALVPLDGSLFKRRVDE